MGLFDTISQAARDTSKAIDESGVLDDMMDAAKDAGDAFRDSGVAHDVAEAVKGATSDDPAHPGVPNGIIDPTGLVTLFDVNEVTGLGFDLVYPYSGEEWIGTTLTYTPGAGQGYFELRVGRAPGDETFNPSDRWNYLKDEVSPQEPVDGLTEEAFRSSPDTIFFRVDDQVIHTLANSETMPGRQSGHWSWPNVL